MSGRRTGTRTVLSLLPLASRMRAPPLGPSDFCVINEIAGDSSSLGGLAHNLPDDFYELSPAEVKAMAQAAAARRAQDETLRTKVALLLRPTHYGDSTLMAYLL